MILPFVRELFADVENLPAFSRVATHLKSLPPPASESAVGAPTDGAIALFSALTTFVVTGEYERDRFDFSSFRDGNGVRVLGGMEFKPTAFISGTAYVGYRSRMSTDGSYPDARTVVASLDLGYNPWEPVRFGIKIDRDLDHSFFATERYYIVNMRGTRQVTQDMLKYRILGFSTQDLLAHPFIHYSASVGLTYDKPAQAPAAPGRNLDDPAAASAAGQSAEGAGIVGHVDLRLGAAVGGAFSRQPACVTEPPT